MKRSRLVRLGGVLAATGLILAACSSDDKASEDTKGTVKSGGEMVDCATLLDSPAHLDPGLVSELDSAQISMALYDGLVDFDYSDRENPVLKPLVADEWSSNDDASMWTFHIKKDQVFSNGDPVLPSSFAFAWNRAANPEFASDYGYLFSIVKGYSEYQDGTATSLAGIMADDEAMTLEVTLGNSNAEFPSIVTHQIFSPMPENVMKDLPNQSDWEKGVMIGNGPFKMEAARTDSSVILIPNEKWGGNVAGDKAPKLDKITFRISSDIDAAFNSFAAGECQTGPIPSGRFAEVTAKYGDTTDPIFGSYHYVFGWKDPVVGGEKNVKLREAISLAIDRDKVNEQIYDGSRRIPTGLTPPGIPGFKADLGEFIKYDPTESKKLLQEWKDAGGSIGSPIKIAFNAGAGHEDVVALLQADLKAVGIDSVLDPKDSTTYFGDLADNGCEQICRAGWFWDYPVFSNGVFDLFHSDSIGGNNLGQYSDAEFDKLVSDGIATVDKDKRYELFQQAESRLLNDTVGYLPMNWYAGDYLYDDTKLENFEQTPLGIINWESIGLKG